VTAAQVEQQRRCVGDSRILESKEPFYFYGAGVEVFLEEALLLILLGIYLQVDVNGTFSLASFQATFQCLEPAFVSCDAEKADDPKGASAIGDSFSDAPLGSTTVEQRSTI